MAPRNSDITVTDQFCGAGGSSIGAVARGLRVRLALNHWKLAIETHNTNFPDTDHDCTDISAADPRRYPSTDILITSPECTTHSPAGGSRRSQPQRDMFKPHQDDPATIRSRATMWDVPRFTEYHRYRAIIVENVLEVTRWELFPEWLATMRKLGYEHRIVSMNSQFSHPTPQSRDRIYIVFWQKGNRAPNLDFFRPAHCVHCDRIVESRQTWKNGRTLGKYLRQYVYTCPDCRAEVRPYYFAALNAIDLSIPAQRIGDRDRPLKPRTMDRLRYGVEKFGRMGLIIRTNMTTDRGYGPGDGGRVRRVIDPLPTQTASWLDSYVAPPGFVVDTDHGHDNHAGVHALDGPLPTQSARQSAALVNLPFLVALANTGGDKRRSLGPDEPLRTIHAGGGNHGVVIPAPVVVTAGSRDTAPVVADEPLPTQTGSERLALSVPPAAMVPMRNNNQPLSLADPLPVVCTGGHHAMVQGAALLTLRDTRANKMVRDLAEPLPTQIASSTQDWILQNAPFLMAYKSGWPVGLDGVIPTVTTVDRVMLAGPGPKESLEDYYFRMLQPPEIGRGMAFPHTYIVLGNRREQVKQYGNGVTPPTMEELISRVTESLAPELAA